MALSDSTPVFTKIDDDTFYVSITANEQVSVAATQKIIADLQSRIAFHLDRLTQAASAGVANAQAALDAVNSQPLLAQNQQATP